MNSFVILFWQTFELENIFYRKLRFIVWTYLMSITVIASKVLHINLYLFHILSCSTVSNYCFRNLFRSNVLCSVVQTDWYILHCIYWLTWWASENSFKDGFLPIFNSLNKIFTSFSEAIGFNIYWSIESITTPRHFSEKHSLVIEQNQ